MAGKNANRTGFSRKSVKGDPKKSKTVAVARPSKRRKASVSPDTTGFKCRAKVGKKMCGRLFDSYSELKKHLKTIHPATRLYFCDHGCERVFTSLSSQTTHHLSDHTDKVVTCPNCVDTFSEVDEFIEHMKVAHPEHKSVIKVPLKFLQSKIPNFNIRSLGHKKAEAVGEDDVGDPVDEEEQDEDEEMRLEGYSPELRAHLTLRNDAYLKHYTGVYHGLQGEVKMLEEYGKLCVGAGKTKCPYQVTIDKSTSFYFVKSYYTSIGLHWKCHLCYKESEKLRRGGNGHKFDDEGNPLCASHATCTAPPVVGSTFCDEHKRYRIRTRLDCLMRKTLAEATENPRKGFGSGITTREEFMKLLNSKSTSFPDAELRELKQLQSRMESGKGVFYVDTEFVGSHAMEITVVDGNGKVVVNTAVDYGLTVGELYVPNMNFMELRTLNRVFGSPSVQRTSGTSPKLIASELKKAEFGKDSLLVEWSSNRCDWTHLKTLLESVGEGDMMPPISNNIRILRAWRGGFPGFVSFTLSFFHRFVFPEQAGLADLAHQSLADTKMLMNLTKVLMDYALKSKHKK